MKIPLYPDSRAIEMADKKLLDRIFSDLEPRVSELSFAGLYLFRVAHDYRLTMIGDAVVVIGKGYDDNRYCLPPLCGDIQKALTVLFYDDWSIYGADEQFSRQYFSADNIQLTEDRDSFDYLYLRQELALLQGNRFHKKNNRINYFTKRHHYQLSEYSAQYCGGCQELLDRWFLAVRDKTGPSLALEVSATSEALRITADLGLSGIVVMVDGMVAGFAIGEKLNSDTAVCHFEKADPFIEGVSQLVNREFARQLFTDCRYINREQDLGDAGLRNSKLSYHPVELVKKYRASSVHS
ncbi:MAG: phosphatidylglycerol lysyltransferase domain-containing protein [Geobacteraceae bacterium]|nr:phosphatidylglycerol lysyltransferase domain-containing protein [Geobacteraceae bacterium]